MMLTPEEYYKSLPKKRVASAVLFWNKNEEFLILHKTYGGEGWNLPGGVTELNESPQAGAIREVEEEIGLIKKDLSFICLDYKPARNEVFSESLQFVFDGGILSDEEIAQIKLSNEHSEFKFSSFNEAFEIFSHYLSLRLKAIMEANKKPVYLEKGRLV